MRAATAMVAGTSRDIATFLARGDRSRSGQPHMLAVAFRVAVDL